MLPIDVDENEVLRDALSGLNDEVPPMPEGLHAAWMQKVEDDMNNSRMENAREKTRSRRSITRFLSVAAAMVFVVGGTMLTRDDLYAKSAPQTNGSARAALFDSAFANGGDYDAAEAYDEELVTEAETAAYGAVMTGSSRSAKATAADTATADKKIIRNASLTISTQTFENSLSALETACEEQGGWIESVSESVSSYTGLRTAYLTLRIPQETLDTYLAGTEALGRITYRSESAQDVTASYQDTQTRLNTQLALMDRLQALITESGDLSDLLALESQIADTQYQIDSLQSALNSTDRQVNYSTVSVTLREEKNADLTDSSVSFGERLTSAIGVGLDTLVGFLGDALVFLVAAAPFIAIVAIVFVTVRLIRKRRRQ